MKKIFLGGFKSCGVHNEKDMIEMLISRNPQYEIIDNYKDADIVIIIDTCMSTYEGILGSIDYVEKVLNDKKEDARVIVSGCLTKGIKFELPIDKKSILDKVECVLPDKVIEYVYKILNIKLDNNILDSFKIPFSIDLNGIQVSPVTGCLNHCSFCKTNFMNFSLKSSPYKNLKKMVYDIEKINSYGFALNHISIYSSNLSLYGIDLYRQPMAHTAINILTSPESIKFAEVGALINWYPELIKEILNNYKIKVIFISLESGSKRIYNLMNRPISLEKLIEVIKLIKRYRPDIIINTEFICGYPTETIDDLKRSIDLVYELDINPQFIHPYCNSPQLPSSKLPQHTFEYCTKSANYAEEKLLELRNKFEEKISSSEMYVIDKDDEFKIYTVMLIDGSIKYVRFDQFDREYNVNDLIYTNSVRCRHLVKRK